MAHDQDGIAPLAWHHFLDELRDLGRLIEGPTGARSSQERAEGYRHLTRMAAMAFDFIFEKGDPSRPEFSRWITPVRKLLGDCPNTIYDAAWIDPERSYVIRGHRGTPTYLAFCVYEMTPDGKRGITSNLNDREIEFAEDGSFEIQVSQNEPQKGGNWLRIGLHSTDIMARQYFLDVNEEEEARYSIETSQPVAAPPPYSEALFSERLARTSEWMREHFTAEMTLSALQERTPNAPMGGAPIPPRLTGGSDYFVGDDRHEAPLDLQVIQKLMPTPDIEYRGCWFELGPNDAMVIEGVAPRAPYWSIHTLSRWEESFDYRYHRVLFTKKDIDLGPDGQFRVVVSHRDPGVPNWLETDGHTGGHFCIRVILPEEPLDVEFRFCDLAELHPGARE